MTSEQITREHRVFTDGAANEGVSFVGFRSGDEIRLLLSRRQCRVIKGNRAHARKSEGLRYILCASLSELARAIMAEGSDTSAIGVTSQQSVSYTESLDSLTGVTTAYLTTLKRPGPHGSYVRWKRDEGFRAARWNPDNVPQPHYATANSLS